MKKKTYLGPVTEITPTEPIGMLALSGETSSGGIGDGGDASTGGFPPLDAPQESETDIWD